MQFFVTFEIIKIALRNVVLINKCFTCFTNFIVMSSYAAFDILNHVHKFISFILID